MNNMEIAYLQALQNSIKSFDKDLAQLIVLSGLSKDGAKIRKMFSLVSHIQNIRAVQEENFTPQEIAMIEATNIQLVAGYKNTEDLPC